MNPPLNVEEILHREAQMMGRDVTYINAWETHVNRRGADHTCMVVLYDCAPLTHGDITIEETRFVVYVDGKQHTGGTI